MEKIHFLIILTNCFGYLSGLLVLSFGASFTKFQRKTFPILKKLDGKQVHLFISIIISSFLFWGSITWKDITIYKLSIQINQDPKGNLIQKATEVAFNMELKEVAEEYKDEAAKFFKTANSKFAKAEYKDAIEYYDKSIKLLPTMSAYLNLGNSYFNLSDFSKAEDAFSSGKKIAKEKNRKRFEAIFLGSLGWLEHF